MEKRRGIIGRVILIAIIYLLLTHWGEVKSGFIAGFNDADNTTINVKAK
jgi:hypothetical protein